jgi:hypothetical protein
MPLYHARERGKEVPMTSSVLHEEPHDPPSVTGRTYAYIPATIIKEVEDPDAQAEVIATYCQRIGRRADDVFIDDVLSGGLPLSGREGPGPRAGRAAGLHEGGGAEDRWLHVAPDPAALRRRLKLRNRVGNRFGYTEIRNLVFRGVDLMRNAGRFEGDSSHVLG